MEIKVTCDSGDLAGIEQLEAFQGKLKSIDAAAFAKLKGSILRYGFSFPIFVWENNILDGHQRLAAAKSLIAEGHTIQGDKLPVVGIDAKDRKEAAEKLLLINSRYAKIDQSGFDLFIEDFEIDVEDMAGLLDIPEVDLKDDQDEDLKDDTIIEKDGLEYKIVIECENELEQIKIIEIIENMGIKCKPLIL